MGKRKGVILGVLLTVGLCALALILTGATDTATPFLPGITVKDDYLNGCVDCHKVAADKKDYRLNVSLAAIKGHPDISKIVKKVPTDCAMCHKAGAKAPALEAVAHKAHYAPAANAFITAYKGACLNCHKFDGATGEMKMKSAAANW